MRIRTTLPIFLSIMALSSCGGPKILHITSFDGTVKVPVTVEIADNASTREYGLMNRKSLAPDTGMLFVFKEPQVLEFWMKNTLIPLEILFFDRDGAFVNAADMTPCKADPCARYKSQALAQYALEVNTDFRAAHKVGVGWRLNLSEVKGMSNPR